MADPFSDFIAEYFVNPIKYPSQYAPYNVVNTLTFALIAIVAVYFIYKFLNRQGITTNEGFYWAVIPYVFFGSIVRALSDAAVLPRAVEIAGLTLYPFITPLIYVVIFLVTISALVISRKFFTNWQEIFSKTGYALALLSFIPLVFLFKNFTLFGAILAIVAVVALFLHFSPWKSNNMEKGIILGQGFDGAATFVGVQFGGYSEQHVLGNAIFSTFGGPWAFFVVKLLFAVLVVYLLRREANEEKEFAFIALIITLFGLAPGTRDALRLLAGI